MANRVLTRPEQKMLPGVTQSVVQRKLGPALIATVLGLVVILALLIASWRGNQSASATSGDPLSLYAQAQQLQNQGNCSDAIALYAKAASQMPTYVNALVGEAQCDQSLHLYSAAVSTLNLALSRDPRNWDTLLARAQLEAQLGQEGLAFADTAKAVKIAPAGAIGALSTAQSIYSRLNDSGDAINMLTLAIKRAPRMASLYSSRAALWAAQNDDEHADADYRMAAHLSSGLTRVANLQAVGDQAMSQGETSEARAAYGHEILTTWDVLYADPKNAEAHLALAHALIGREDKSHAEQELQRGIALGDGGTSWMTALQTFADWASGANQWPMAEIAYRAEVKAARAYLRSHRGDATASSLLSHAASQLPSG